MTLFADASRWRSAEGLWTWPTPTRNTLAAPVAETGAVKRVTEMLLVGLNTEASANRRGEQSLIQHHGQRRRCLCYFDLYTRAQSFQRPHLWPRCMAPAPTPRSAKSSRSTTAVGGDLSPGLPAAWSKSSR